MSLCGVCSAPLPDHTGAGRPRKYCSRKCVLESNIRWKAQNPDKIAQWEEAHRHPCADCGDSIGRQAVRCWDCEVERRRARRVEVHRLWHEGKTVAVIAALLGTTKGAMQVCIVYMRREGWDMPYRRRMGRNERRVAA